MDPNNPAMQTVIVQVPANSNEGEHSRGVQAYIGVIPNSVPLTQPQVTVENRETEAGPEEVDLQPMCLRKFNTDLLITLVEERPAIYNSHMKEHYNFEYMKRMWEEISKEMGATEIRCKAKWNNLESLYVSFVKGEADPADLYNVTKNDKINIGERLAFMKSYVNDLYAQMKRAERHLAQYLKAPQTLTLEMPPTQDANHTHNPPPHVNPGFKKPNELPPQRMRPITHPRPYPTRRDRPMHPHSGPSQSYPAHSCPAPSYPMQSFPAPSYSAQSYPTLSFPAPPFPQVHVTTGTSRRVVDPNPTYKFFEFMATCVAQMSPRRQRDTQESFLKIIHRHMDEEELEEVNGVA